MKLMKFRKKVPRVEGSVSRHPGDKPRKRISDAERMSLSDMSSASAPLMSRLRV